MDVKLPWFVEELRKRDPEFFSAVKGVAESAMNTRALDAKTTYLVVLALDAAKNADQGVRVLASQAREAGASEEEIKEVLRLAYYVSGMDVIKTSLNAYD
ncbi:4-carboxymuconolactone decarboxylase [hydrocarbon metagenome]|uniref:4-carboxymuconolactone decarboxylase n=1 Tax=hydrocarbon metagenome TaxID=938273 RepID=A0A0W8E624_9ZZZZ